MTIYIYIVFASAFIFLLKIQNFIFKKIFKQLPLPNNVGYSEFNGSYF